MKRDPKAEPKKKDSAQSNREAQRAEFAAQYETRKQQEIEKLAKEIEARSASENKSKHRMWWIKTILLLALIGFSIFLLFGISNYLTPESTKSFPSLIRGINWRYFIALLGVVLLYILFESTKYAYLLKISTGKWRYPNAIKVMFLGKYYDGITPLGTGGQPFQIHYLHKKDIPAGVATAVPLVKFIVNTFALGILAAAFFILAPYLLQGNSAINTTLLIIAWVSMAANMLIPIAIVFASLFPRAGKKFAVGLISLLNKMKIVKHKYPTMRKYVYEIEEYRSSLRAIFRRWWLIIPLFLICLVGMFISFCIPYFVVVALADVAPTGDLLLKILCLSMISYYSASLIPTPGTSGAIETTSSLIFSSVLQTNPEVSVVIGWIILVWRFFTYYLYILSGIGINIFEIIRGAYRNRRADKKRMEAAAERAREEVEEFPQAPPDPPSAAASEAPSEAPPDPPQTE